MQETTVQQLNETLFQIYLKNLDFLEEHFKEVHKKISILSTSLDEGLYERKFDLEYVDGYFNIKDLENDTYIYEGNSYEYSDKLTEDADKSKDNSTALLSIDPDLKKLSKNTLVKDFWPLIDCINDHVDFDTYEFTKIYKYMFVGTGLGMHIDYINRKYNPNAIYIVEPNIEIFNLSLFITDYTTLYEKNKKALYMSIAEDRKKVLKSTATFMAYQPYLNYSVKHVLFTKRYGGLLSDIATKMMNSHSSLFSYKSQLKSFKTTFKYMKEDYNFLRIKPLLNSNRLKKYPTLIISAGPSVAKNMEWIKENQKKFYIIAVNTILPALEKHDIRPDIIVTIDPGIEVYLENIRVLKDAKKFLKDIPVVASSQVSIYTTDHLEKDQVFLFQLFPIIKSLGTFLSSANVGTYAMNLAVLLGCQNIYTIGNDCALDKTTGRIYSEGTTGRSIDIEAKKYEKSKEITQFGDLMEVKGNLDETVFTTLRLYSFKDDYEHVIDYLKDTFKVTIYNLSNGAFIEGMEPQAISDIKIDEFKEIKKYKLKKFFTKHTGEIELPDFRKDIKEMNKSIQKIKKFESLKIKDRNHFLNKQLELLTDLLDIYKELSISSFGMIFIEFLELSGIYLYFFINIKGDHLNDKEVLNQTKRIWANTLLDLLKDMKKDLLIKKESKKEE